MKLKDIKTRIVAELEERDIIVNCIKIRGYHEDKNIIQKITISIEDISSSKNILYEVKNVLDNTEDNCGISILEKFIEI
ncbi:hypothetical protein ACR77J_07810 [Tissierella praeacuta]|uniref:hypothetical protein n=1 Tax=Tissierella praeacuta TaxID=43131 RepID=UPI003DA67AC0